MKLKSTFALLDVKKGRKELFKRLGFTGRGKGERVPVTITGYIVGAWGDDDGTSREFEIEVTDLAVSE